MGDSDAVSVLMAEDAIVLREPVALYLRSIGYDVIEAEDGARALAILESDSKIDVFFTDVQMPGINGDALANRLARSHPGMPVILTSGNVSLDLITEGVAPRRFVRKPYDLDVIEFNIRDLTGKTPAGRLE